MIFRLSTYYYSFFYFSVLKRPVLYRFRMELVGSVCVCVCVFVTEPLGGREAGEGEVVVGLCVCGCGRPSQLGCFSWFMLW
jgi:hypothetical protein